MRICLVLPSLFIPRVGGRIRFRQWIELLSRHHDLEVFATRVRGFDERYEAAARILANTYGCTLHVAEEGVPNFFLSPFPRRAVKRSGLSTESAVAAAHGDCPFDVIVMEHSYAALGAFRWCALRPRPTLILDEHNVESALLLAERRAPLDVGRVPKRLEVTRYALYERCLWHRVDYVLTVSSLERDYIARRVAVPVVWVPIAVTLERSVQRVPDLSTLLFVGHLSFAPNIDAAIYLVRDVLPLILERFPAAHVQLVGRSPAPSVRALRGPRVDVFGDVAEVTPFLARASVAVQPVRMGAGVKIKAIEALAAGVPLVTSTHVARPWGIRDGEHAFVADTPQTTAEAIMVLLANPGGATQMIAAGRRLAAQFDSRQIDRQFEDLIYTARTNIRHPVREHKVSLFGF